MTGRTIRSDRVLAVYPMWRGIAFAVCEGPTSLLKWGVAQLYSKVDDEFLQRIEGLIDLYDVAIVAMENADGSRRRAVARRRVELVRDYAAKRQLDAVQTRWSDVQTYFGKEMPREIALVLGDAFPELRPHVPPVRRLWESEDARTSLFKAVAMAVMVSREASRQELAA